MNTEKHTCNCPICNQEVEPADGLTAEQRLVYGILTLAKEMQNDSKLPNCPRCGRIYSPGADAESRAYDIKVCPECGSDEALRAENNNNLPVEKWWIVEEIFKLRG